MTFDYFRTTTAQDSINIEDIGNVALQAFRDNGEESLLVIMTKLGRSSIYQFGPLVGGTNVAENYFRFVYNQIDYNEKRLAMVIDNFINAKDNVNPITQVFFTDKDEAMNRLKEVELQ